MRFNGSAIDFKSTENEFSVKNFDGTVWVEFEKINGKPSVIKINSSVDKGDICISTQFKKDQLACRDSVSTGSCEIDISKYGDGRHIITATMLYAENVSVRYEFI